MIYYIKRKPITILFIIFEALLFLLIHFADLSNRKAVCFTSIAFCFLYSLLYYKKKDVIFEISALLFTVISDVFLVLLRARQQGLAMVFFSIAQLMHFAFIFSNQTDKKDKTVHLIVRVALSIITIIISVLTLKDKTDFVSVISMFYFANLIVNIIYAFKNYNAFPLLAVGLSLFIMCDVCVGLQSAVGVYLNIEKGSTLYNMLYPGIDLVWLFYLPSQTLISLNTKYYDKK